MTRLMLFFVIKTFISIYYEEETNPLIQKLFLMNFQILIIIIIKNNFFI